jgi:hypothetical protein
VLTEAGWAVRGKLGWGWVVLREFHEFPWFLPSITEYYQVLPSDSVILPSITE